MNWGWDIWDIEDTLRPRIAPSDKIYCPSPRGMLWVLHFGWGETCHDGHASIKAAAKACSICRGNGNPLSAVDRWRAYFARAASSDRSTGAGGDDQCFESGRRPRWQS